MLIVNPTRFFTLFSRTLLDSYLLLFAVFSLSFFSGCNPPSGIGGGTPPNTTPSVTSSNASIAEGESGSRELTFTLTLNTALAESVTLDFSTTDGSASAGSDYTASSGTITFAAGESSKMILIAISGDTDVESNETFVVNFSNISDNVILARSSVTGTIINDDGALVPVASFVVVDTNQGNCYSATSAIACGSGFVGQDAQYAGPAPSYTDNGDQTVTDNNTGLMWSAVTINDVEFADADSVAAASSHAGYSDWRVPAIKELYSLMDFSGSTGLSENDAVPYLDSDYFDMEYFSTGVRYIDAQYLSSTAYVGTVFDGQAAFFGVNFADGRIKGYPQNAIGNNSAAWNLRLVRGTVAFENDFVNNNDGTISDNASGLMWMQVDSGSFAATAGSQNDGRVDWQEALAWCEGLSYGGFEDWRLPNAKEMQSIVDYTRAPDITASAAIDPLFNVTAMLDPEEGLQYPYFWTSTTHLDGLIPGDYAVYIPFGEAQGRFNAQTQQTGASETLLDVHGAGAQRSDPKSGNINDYPDYHGPQGDVIYVYNHARCVRQ